jgi:CHAT domain-containing protein
MSTPEQFAYLHFVTHGTASTTAPLESAIILSREQRPGEASPPGLFKLYARDILQHPLDARLVTISACYGSGARSYSGEGLIGLAWAFLRAGAHNVIASLWEVTDESTPRLMDNLYTGIGNGLEPAAALRNAKLSLLHSKTGTHAPFYWAGFGLYAGH